MGIHDDHRSRLRARFLREGLNGFEDVNALELILFYAIPRKDTNVLAHRLLDRFGSFNAVLEADTHELTDVEGVGENVAALLRLIRESSRRYEAGKFPKNKKAVTDPKIAADVFRPRFVGETEEVVYALLLDAGKKEIACAELSRGVVNAAEISVRKIGELCMTRRASAVIMAHNHPGGTCAPSEEDVETTASIRRSLRLLDIELCDHLIFAGEGWCSMLQDGYLDG